MKATPTEIPDVLLIEPMVFEDDRGFFFESFNQNRINEATGWDVTFVQDNHSRSARGVLRGLHYQLPPAAQGKLVRCVVGEVFDVAVDIRKHSATFGQWVGKNLSAENRCQMWVPEGFAHGFLVMSDFAELLYKATAYYTPEFERAIRWDDVELQIEWPIDSAPAISAKDAEASSFPVAEVFL
jgi:dTDP-4-dehydrorhamnose 3,5-epimerase